MDYPFLGEMRDRGTHKIAWLTAQVPALSAERPWGPSPAVETNVALVPIFPGIPARFLDAVADTGPKAVVLEGYGLGGVPFMGENLLPAIERGIARGIPFVLRVFTVRIFKTLLITFSTFDLLRYFYPSPYQNVFLYI